MLYSIDNPKQVRTGHAVLVGPPLVVIMLFCFALVLIQPHPSAVRHIPSASNQSTPPTLPAQAALPNLEFAPATTLATLGTSSSTATPQPAPPMDSKMLQAASLNNQSVGITMPKANNPPKTVLITPGSASQNKGKTTSSSSGRKNH